MKPMRRDDTTIALVGLGFLILGLLAAALVFEPKADWTYDVKGKEVYDLDGTIVE